jgi:hypothetical protein
MGTTVRVPVSASIWNWVTKIGSFQSLTDDDHRKIER